jgi:hypothetical protein
MKKPSVRAMREHVGSLLVEHELLALGNRHRPRVVFAPVTSESTYLDALERIGFVLGWGYYTAWSEQHLRFSREWAKQHALAWTPTMQAKREADLAEIAAIHDAQQHSHHG